MNFFIRTLLVQLVPITGFCCSCPPSKSFQDELVREWEISTDIIQVKVFSLERKKNKAKAVVLENFKGNSKEGDTITLISTDFCYPYIDDLGTWLIYSKLHNGTLNINPCGLSRDLERPENNMHFSFPLPPPLLEDSISLEEQNYNSNRNKVSYDSIQFFLTYEAPLIELNYLTGRKRNN